MNLIGFSCEFQVKLIEFPQTFGVIIDFTLKFSVLWFIRYTSTTKKPTITSE